MASVTVRVEGLSELGRNLSKFSEEIKRRLVRKAARAAGKEVSDTAKSIFKSRWKRGDEPLHVEDAIGVRRMSKASNPPGREFVAVGVFSVGGKKANNPGKGAKNPEPLPKFYWKFLEFGTVKLAAKPFLVPAFDQKKAGSPEVMRKVLKDGMAAATRKFTKARTKGKP